MHAVCCMLYAVFVFLCDICCMLYVICYVLYAICCMLNAICLCRLLYYIYMLYAIHYMLYAISCMLYAIIVYPSPTCIHIVTSCNVVLDVHVKIPISISYHIHMYVISHSISWHTSNLILVILYCIGYSIALYCMIVCDVI